MHLFVRLLMFMLLASPPLLAATPEFEQGKQHYKEQRYPAALSALLIAFEEEPANPQINFLLGRTYFELNNFEAAIMAFERVLFVDPSSFKTKKEMTRSLKALKGQTSP